MQIISIFTKEQLIEMLNSILNEIKKHQNYKLKKYEYPLTDLII